MAATALEQNGRHASRTALDGQKGSKQASIFVSAFHGASSADGLSVRRGAERTFGVSLVVLPRGLAASSRTVQEMRGSCPSNQNSAPTRSQENKATYRGSIGCDNSGRVSKLSLSLSHLVSSSSLFLLGSSYTHLILS
ncbi:hypothetical protein V8C34DRAFT_273576 [Trichoderma compactum]